MQRLAPQLGLSNAPELAKRYPEIPFRVALDQIFRDIGTKKLGFKGVRDPKFTTEYGITPTPAGQTTAQTATASPASQGSSSQQHGTHDPHNDQKANQMTPKVKNNGQGSQDGSDSDKGATSSAYDQASVKEALRQLSIRGNNRKKVVVLRDEMLSLNLNKNPLAFCFLLRSMFEISAKAYCEDNQSNNGPSNTEGNGRDKTLAKLLGEIVNHLSDGRQNTQMLRRLHGAITELQKADSLLSVTSMNQLVHNPNFLVAPRDICILFNNIYPLLEELNK